MGGKLGLWRVVAWFFAVVSVACVSSGGISAGVIHASNTDLGADKAKQLDSDPPVDAAAIVEIYDAADAKHERVYVGDGFSWADGTESVEPGYQLWIPQRGAVSQEANHFVVWLREKGAAGDYEVTILLKIDDDIVSLEKGARIDLAIDKPTGVVRVTFDGKVKLRDDSLHTFAGRLVSKILWKGATAVASPPPAPVSAADTLRFGAKEGTYKSETWDIVVDAAPLKAEETSNGLSIYGPPSMLGKTPFIRVDLTKTAPVDKSVLDAKAAAATRPPELMGLSIIGYYEGFSGPSGTSGKDFVIVGSVGKCTLVIHAFSKSGGSDDDAFKVWKQLEANMHTASGNATIDPAPCR